MYIRRTQSRLHNGVTYHTHRLVQSERDGKQVRQRTLLNLGRHFFLDRELWPLLCQQVEEGLSGQSGLSLGIPAEVEAEANRIIEQLLIRRSRVASGKPDLQTVDVSSLELSRPRSIGVEQVALWALQELGLPELLRSLQIGPSLRDAALGSVVARMAHPSSERATHHWLQKRSGIGELLETDFETMGAMQLYRASDALMKHRQVIENHLFGAAMKVFDLSPTITLYDLTNTYFEGEAQESPKASRGHSKEKRTDRPLLTLALVLDGSGFVRRSRVFDGNVREMTTLEPMLEALGAPQGALVVMDRGIATEDRVKWLVESGYRYVVVSREQHREFDAGKAIDHKTRTGGRIHLQRKESEDGREVRLWCHSPQRGEKERAIVERFGKRFEKALEDLSDSLSRPRAFQCDILV